VVHSMLRVRLARTGGTDDGEVVLACVCLCLTYRLGMQVQTAERGERTGYTHEGSSAAAAAAVDIAAGYTGGAVGCAVVGADSAFGVALIQMSENRRKTK